MTRSAIPWLMVAFAAGALVGATLLRSGPEPELSEEVALLRAEIAELRELVQPAAPPPVAARPTAHWLEEARKATHQNAESVTEKLVASADGVVRGEVADAVLHLLRDGTRIPRCFVMRGIAHGGARELDERIVTRCVEIARSVPLQDYDSHYFFAFVAPLVDPKSDDLVDFITERAFQSKTSTDEYLETLRAGASDAQLGRCADLAMDLAEQTEDEHLRYRLLKSLLWLARPEHAKRLDGLGEDEAVEGNARQLARQAAKSARTR